MSSDSLPNIHRARPFSAFLALAGLSALGIAQPLLDLLGKSPQFLTVHHINRWDLFFLIVLLTIAPGIILGLMVWLADRINRPFGKIVFSSVATVLLSILIGPMIKGVPLPTLIVALTGVLIAFLIVWKIGGNPKLQSFWNFLGLIPLLVAGLFITQTGPRAILFPHDSGMNDQGMELPPPQSDIPVVFIVFDAFPTNSIMNENHEIDEVLCPNLASLNNDAVWYRNALSISDDTLLAVPSILTGLLPIPGQQPTAAFLPNNLFSWLKPWRTVHSLESHTQLNSSMVLPSLRDRWGLTTSDLWIIFQHTVLPKGYTVNLPSITHDWRNFAKQDASGEKQHVKVPRRLQLFEDFLESITKERQGDCFFLHTLVPHTPYQFLPSGRRYSTGGKEPSGQGMQFGKWSMDLQAVVHSQQRLLNQVGYADRLIGEVLTQLKDSGLYQNSLIIFTADHGMCFTPGDSRRKLTPSNRGEILPVPLIIKYPASSGGSIDDRVVQTIDIMPTIASVLDSPLPYTADGQSLLDPNYLGHEKTRYLGAASTSESMELDTQAILEQRDASIRTKHQRFPGFQGGLNLSAPFRGSQLVGTEIPVDIPSWDQWSISLAGSATRIFSSSLKEIIPAEVQGQIIGKTPLPPHWDIAILIDRKVASLTRPFSEQDHNETAVWSTLLTDEILEPGQHQLDIALVEWSNGSPRFFAPGKKEMSALGRNLILDTIYISKTSGLYKTGLWGEKPAAWTKGAANLNLKLPTSDRPNSLEVQVLAGSPKGSTLMVFANGVLLGVESLKKFPWTGSYDLSSVNFDENLRLSLFSNTHIPAEYNSKSTDNRSLGLALSIVELKVSSPNSSHEASNSQVKPVFKQLTPGQAQNNSWSQIYNPETWRDGLTTWTKGNAVCTATWQHPDPPRFLLVEIAGTAPDGSPLSIVINNTEVVSKKSIKGNWTQLIDISQVPPAEQMKITILSNTFTPIQKDGKTNESRVLGVALRQVIMVQ